MDITKIRSYGYHPITEALVEANCRKTQSDGRLFFRVFVSYYLAKMATAMRVTLDTIDRGEIPLNMYALNLATSGFGKGMSMNLMEDTVLHKFRDRFTEETFPYLSEKRLEKVAHERVAQTGKDFDSVLGKVQKEFKDLGEISFAFDSGTVAAAKQYRQKLLMSEIGSINLEIDEIGSNIDTNSDLLELFLELYDVGKTKQKLIKNTAENQRGKEIHGRTPANLLMFGTPARLLNGGKEEDKFFVFQDSGYARRTMFAYIDQESEFVELDPKELLKRATDSSIDDELEKIANDFYKLADPVLHKSKVKETEEAAEIRLEYEQYCKKRATEYAQHEEMRKAEMRHRYFKVLKLAGMYAWIEFKNKLEPEHIYMAINLVEDSGEAFNKILTRDRNYVKLAKYIASTRQEVTQVELTEDLPFYKGSAAVKTEMLTMAVAWGYKNNIIIKKMYDDGIEFLKGESLECNDLTSMILSYSEHEAYHYDSVYLPFEDMHDLVTEGGLHWVTHHVKDAHRLEDKCIPGFNMIVLDCDGEVQLETAKLLLKGHKALYYTTKSHTEEVNCFRIVLPTSHTLKMGAEEFTQFMNNVYAFLPFDVDTCTGQRSKKWLSCGDAHYEYTDGELFDVLSFIPKTSKNEKHQQTMMDTQSLSNLERWFVTHTGDGNRSNNLIRYAFMLLQQGQKIDQVTSAVLALNNKLPDKLEESEIYSTILYSAGKRADELNG